MSPALRLRALAGLHPGWWALLCAGLLALRKPWALHTPQLWAEDGSIFLVQAEQMGLGAWFEPYNGYLHLLPRLIAWFAPLVADVAWWPAIYNTCAFALNVAVFVRLASPRIALPAKPGLMLAFVLVAGTGEVLINVTNVQWVTAFLLLLQLFAVRPATVAQRIGDLAILLVVGLNGPFAIVFFPLFAWRAWRERTPDPALAAGAVAVCAAVQGMLLLRTGPGLHLEGAAAPFQPLAALSILGSRLVTWPLLGPEAVLAWPRGVHAALGLVVLVALPAWALRRDARLPIRALIVAAFVFITVASLYRVRADTWARDDLWNGDRYFYLPRVLLAWLLVWELDARPRAVAWAARLACILAVVTNARHHVLPALPDYKWAEHCDPIRRGVPGNIYTLPEGWWIEYPGRPAPK